MKPARRLVTCTAIAIAACGCAAETLDAGSTSPPAKPTTRLGLDAMIDAITMDATDLYFTSEDGWVYRLAKAGSSAPARVAPAGAPGSLYTEGIVVDDAFVYWTALGDGVAHGAVFRAPKSGGAPVALAEAVARPWSIALDGDAVVWAEEGATVPVDAMPGIGKGTISRIDKSGRGGVEVLAAPLDAPDFLAIDEDGNVVWHELEAIRRLAPGSTSAETLLSRPAPFRSTNLVVAGGRVAWADAPAGAATVWSVDASGEVIALATGIDVPDSLAASGETVFWNVETGSHAGAIHSASAGADETILAQDTPGDAAGERALFLLADEHAFYSVLSWESKSLTVEIRTLPR